MLDVYAVLEAEEQRRLRRLARKTNAAAQMADAAAAEAADRVERGEPVGSVVSFDTPIQGGPGFPHADAFATQHITAAVASFETVPRWLASVDNLSFFDDVDERSEHPICGAFVSEGIDFDVLRYVTEKHLSDLGVERIGDRLRILAARDRLFHASPGGEGSSVVASTLLSQMGQDTQHTANISAQLRSICTQQQLLLHAIQVQHSDHTRRERSIEHLASGMRDATTNLTTSMSRLFPQVSRNAQTTPMMPYASPDAAFLQAQYAQAAQSQFHHAAQMAAFAQQSQAYSPHTYSSGGSTPTAEHSPTPVERGRRR
jgi:SAM domain (Sterile alpha motif)